MGTVRIRVRVGVRVGVGVRVRVRVRVRVGIRVRVRVGDHLCGGRQLLAALGWQGRRRHAWLG